jgi:serine O-acetyltransferase
VIGTLIEDSRRSLRTDRASVFTVFSAFVRNYGFRIIVYHRIAHMFRRRGWRVAAGFLHRRGCLLGADIHPDAKVGSGLCLPHPYGIVIGHGVRIGCRARILQGVTVGGVSGRKRSDGSSQPYIGDDVILGAGAKILGPVSIGDRVRIGANAVVLQDIPSDCNAAGVPARILAHKERGERA